MSIIGDYRRIEFTADRRNHRVHPGEERSLWPHLVCDLSSGDRGPLVDGVYLAP